MSVVEEFCPFCDPVDIDGVEELYCTGMCLIFKDGMDCD